jgi:hypothetical protein
VPFEVLSTCTSKQDTTNDVFRWSRIQNEELLLSSLEQIYVLQRPYARFFLI